jgi:ankyrin repeat protein
MNYYIMIYYNIFKYIIILKRYFIHQYRLNIIKMSLRYPSNIEKYFDGIPLEDIIRNNILDRYGNNVLHTAIVFDDPNRFYISQLQIFNNVKNNKGNTPLHLACARGDVLLLYFLIHKYAINIYEINNNGENLLDIAIAFKQKEVIIILVKYYHTDDTHIFKCIKSQINKLKNLNESFDKDEIKYITECFCKDFTKDA